MSDLSAADLDALRRHHSPPNCCRLDARPREGNREVAIVGPERKQIAIARIVWIARLTGCVGPDRALPVSDVDDDSKRRAGCLIPAVAGDADGGRVATARRGAALEWACTEGLTLIAERHRSVDLWTTRLGARITVAPLTSIDVSVSRSGPVDGGRLRSVVIGFNREFSRD